MDDPKFCRHCHTPLIADATQGLCPECLASADANAPQAETAQPVPVPDELPETPASRNGVLVAVIGMVVVMLLIVIAAGVVTKKMREARTNTLPAAPVPAPATTPIESNAAKLERVGRMNELDPGPSLQLVKVDSEETSADNGYGENAIDGKPDTFWHTRWSEASPGLPHEIIIKLFPAYRIRGFTYLPRQDESDHGTIKEYEFYVSNDGENFGEPVKRGTFEPGKGIKRITFEPVKCSFVKLRAISEVNGLRWTSAAEIGVIPADR